MSVSLLKAIVLVLPLFIPDNRASIVLSNDYDSISLPVVPGSLPAIENPQNNETFSSVLGDFNIIGTMGLRQISWDGLLPNTAGKYSWCLNSTVDATTAINFIRKAQLSYKPIRLAITYANGSEYLNMLATIDKFTYYADNVHDFHYSIGLKEYRKITTEGSLTS